MTKNFLEINPLPLRKRIRELFLDWLAISLYLLVLLGVTTLFYRLTFGGTPPFSEGESQLIALLFSVLPIVLVFSYLDTRRGTLGRQMVGLTLIFKGGRAHGALVRNVIKFLPWQLGHMGTIHGLYNNFNRTSLVLYFLSLGLLILIVYMGLFSKDKRHLGDLLAGTQVVEVEGGETNGKNDRK